MKFSLEYAKEDRKRMMTIFKEAASELFKSINIDEEI